MTEAPLMQATPTTYELATIADLLKVPADRREKCLEELALSLEFIELTHGEHAAEALKSIAWTDDGGLNQTMDIGGEVLTLEVQRERGAGR